MLRAVLTLSEDTRQKFPKNARGKKSATPRAYASKVSHGHHIPQRPPARGQTIVYHHRGGRRGTCNLVTDTRVDERHRPGNVFPDFTRRKGSWDCVDHLSTWLPIWGILPTQFIAVNHLNIGLQAVGDSPLHEQQIPCNNTSHALR